MEQLKHECGVAMIRLLKPLDYYQQKYGTWMYGLNKLYLMMEKQHNRGQEGAGLACVKLSSTPGNEYMFRERALGSNAITDIFGKVQQHFKDLHPEQLADAEYAKESLPFAGELYMGHLRYSTTGKSGLSYVHPFLRRNNWRAKNLALCGNFNMTNVDEIFQKITSQGQHPRIYSDTYIMLELMGHRLDREVERNFQEAENNGLTGKAITHYIEDNVQMSNVLRTSLNDFDGGYVVCGVTGSGEMFSMRDPWGIRPAFWYKDDEIVVLASERPVIQTAFDVECNLVNELNPGQALLVKKNGEVSGEQILEQKAMRACSFERIYFSRGSDRDIYKERKQLGAQLVQPILKTVDNDLEHTVFSFIPNTAEVAFYGMIDGIENETKKAPRVEKVLIKDIKLRTFISTNNERDDLATHVYDVTYGTIKRGKVENLVAIDDSIVRGTTLKQSILKIMNRLEPKKIVIVSSSPQVRYPDYYGIDMAKMSEFCAFRAAIQLLKDRGMQSVIDDVYARAKAQENLPKEEVVNYVTDIYKPFTMDEISVQIAKMLTPKDVDCPVELVYQTVEGLHEACPNHKGDWYFTGDYPTPGGNRLVNKAFINYYEGKEMI